MGNLIKKKSILLVDDEDIIRLTLGSDLIEAGYDVSLVENGEEAIARMQDNHFDLIITDLMMDGIDGIQVLKEVKRKNPTISVIIFTGYGDITTAIDALRLGADDYLLKPCIIEELLLRISRCFEKQNLLEKLRIKNQELENEIIKHQQTEEALQQSEKRFRLALDATSDGVWDRNLITNEVYYGENWARILGYSLNEVEQRQLSWEKLLHPDDKSGAMDKVKKHLDGETSQYVAEFRMRNKAGSWKWILARGKIVEWDKDDRPLRFVGTHTDISGRKRVEEALAKKSEKIKLLAYSMAHDIKNPILTIYGFAKLLSRNCKDTLDEKVMNYCDQILKTSEHLVAFVEKTNAYISTQETSLNLETIRIKELTKMIREEFVTRLALRQIQWVEPEEFPEIKADRISVLRVLRNLVDNALKYGGDVLSEIEVGYKESDESHILFIRDDGVGLQQDKVRGVFELFKREKTSLGIKGSGLGLAIVKEIAEQHQGKVWTEPGLEKGIIFYISLSKSLSTDRNNPTL